jgi:hypothetical protein
MKLANFDEVEVKRILEMHSKEKKGTLINEQSSNSKTELETMITKGCIKNGTLQALNTKMTPEKWSIKQISAVDPNKKRYFLITGEVLLYDGTKLTKLQGKWDVNACRTKELKQASNIASSQEIEKGGWLTIDQAKQSNLDLTPGMFETKIFNGIPYYRKAGKTIGGAASAEQKEVVGFLIDRYGARFQRTKDNLDPKNPQSFCWAFQGEHPLVEPNWTLIDVVGGTEYGVKEGLKIFMSPACLKNVRKASKDVVSAESGFRKIDNDTCKDFLKNYMEAYENGVDTTTTAFTQLKKDVQSCKRKFCSKDISKTQGKCEGRWKLGLMGGSRKLDDIIDFFSGENNPIGTPPERTNPYRIA